MSSSQFTIKIGVNSAGVADGISKAVNQVARLQTAFNSVRNVIGGALAGGGIIGALRTVDSFLDRLQEKAKQIKFGSHQSGLDPVQFQQFQNTIEATGNPVEKGLKALENLAEATEKIKSGADTGNKLADSFGKFGVTLEDIKKKDYRAVFFQIADAMKTMTVNAQILNALGNLGIKDDLIPAMKIGFGSKIANGGILDSNDLAQLDKLNKMAAEAAGPWINYGNEVLLTLTKVKVGLLSIPDVAMRLWNDRGLKSAEHDPAGAHFKGIQEKLTAAKNEAAQLQIQQKAAAARAAEEQKIRDSFAARRNDLEAAIAAERFSQLTSEQKLFVLKKQAEVIRQMTNDTEISMERDGDATGEKATKLKELELLGLKNKSDQLGLQPGARGAGGSSNININDQQRRGALIMDIGHTLTNSNLLQDNNRQLGLTAQELKNLREQMIRNPYPNIQRDGGAFGEGYR
jgi:hypothetical protein